MAGNPAGKSGKGRAAKRQRQERVKSHSASFTAEQAGAAAPLAPLKRLLSSDAEDKKKEPLEGWRAEHRAGAGKAQPCVRTPLEELRQGEKCEAATVTGVHAFGAFLNISAAKDGLLPANELQGIQAAVGQQLTVYVKHVSLARGRISLTRLEPGESPRRMLFSRLADAPRASGTSSICESVGESLASKSSRRSSSTWSHSSSHTMRAESRLAAIEALAATLAATPTGVHLNGTVVNRTRFGVFVRLSGPKLTNIMGACLEDSLVKISAPTGSVSVDGALFNAELNAAYDAGLIGSADTANGVHVGKQVDVYVVEVNVAQQQLRLSLMPLQPPKAASNLSVTESDQQSKEESKQPAQVDEETLAARLHWKAPPPPEEEVAPPLVVRTVRRFPEGSFRTIQLVKMAWKH